MILPDFFASSQLGGGCRTPPPHTHTHLARYVPVLSSMLLLVILILTAVDESNRKPFYNLFVNCNNYRQLISTTDNQTIIDHNRP